jgi:hypothetical protein
MILEKVVVKDRIFELRFAGRLGPTDRTQLVFLKLLRFFFSVFVALGLMCSTPNNSYSGGKICLPEF